MLTSCWSPHPSSASSCSCGSWSNRCSKVRIYMSARVSASTGLLSSYASHPRASPTSMSCSGFISSAMSRCSATTAYALPSRSAGFSFMHFSYRRQMFFSAPHAGSAGFYASLPRRAPTSSIRTAAAKISDASTITTPQAVLARPRWCAGRSARLKNCL